VTYIVGSSPGTHAAYSTDTYVVGTPTQALRGTAGNAGDTDGDGVDELALTADLWGYSWDVVALYQQPPFGALEVEDADVQVAGNDSFVAGYTQIGHADVNGDGHDDLVVGSPGDNGNDGAVLVFHGVLFENRTTPAADLELIGRKDSGTGKAVAFPGDLDGDGNDELLIGAPRIGAVYLHRGGETGRWDLDAEAQASFWRAEDASDSGGALATGDLTGDSIAEFAIGAPYADDVKRDEGAVVLWPSLDL
jgi:hypothetical protein